MCEGKGPDYSDLLFENMGLITMMDVFLYRYIYH